ncbi:MAG: choline/carnitine O-acyltransferase [Solirubrobacterales bacterium]|nr:choline/carnitine O-acyltransferase [Solirubrobacterales bacterium]
MPTSDISPRTFGNEDSLPRVPLPTLERSVERFLEWSDPLLDAEQRADTRRAAAEFQAADGPARRAQAELEREEAEQRGASWLDDFWRSRYLGRRDRIALNANFFFLFRDGTSDQITRAAELIRSAVEFKRAIEAGSVPPTVRGGRPQSMVQLKHVFSTTRIPGLEQDTVRTPYSADWRDPSDAHHIVVFRRGHLFAMDVLDQQGNPFPMRALTAELQSIITAGAEHAPAGTSIGPLTTMARADWANARSALLACDEHNKHQLDMVERALFCLSLDDHTPADPDAACHDLLAGDSTNRFFDKALSLIVFADGTAGLNGEHSLLDGTSLLAAAEAMLAWDPPSDETSDPRAIASGQAVPRLTQVEFTMDRALTATVTRAAEEFAAYSADTATRLLRVKDFTSENSKALGVSPDAFVQIAFQLAHVRAKGRIGATYESIATRGYKHGRTEAMRVITPELAHFVELMGDPASPREARRAAFDAAAAAHIARVKQCQSGDAPEQHLWELGLRIQRHGEPTPALYDSPGWRVMRADAMSTSSLPSDLIQVFGFGATGGDCLGVGYSLRRNRFDLYLATPKSAAAGLEAFAAALPDALAELSALLSS